MKSLFFMLIVIGSLLVVSASSLWLSWIGLEVSTLFFLTLSSYEKSSSTNIFLWRYLVTQIIGSALLVSALLSPNQTQVFSLNLGDFDMWGLLAMVGLLLKMGFPPFHGWMLNMSQIVTWLDFLILSTVMKIGPIFLLNSICTQQSHSLLLAVAFMSLLVGCLGVVDTSIRRILVCSSLVNMSWMMMGLKLASWQSIVFMLTYFVLLVGVCLVLMSENISHTSDLLEVTSMLSRDSKLILLFSIASIVGLPPLIMFILKLDILCTLTNVSPMVLLLSFQVVAPAIFMILIYMNFMQWSVYTKGFFTQKSPIKASSALLMIAQVWGMMAMINFI